MIVANNIWADPEGIEVIRLHALTLVPAPRAVGGPRSWENRSPRATLAKERTGGTAAKNIRKHTRHHFGTLLLLLPSSNREISYPSILSVHRNKQFRLESSNRTPLGRSRVLFEDGEVRLALRNCTSQFLRERFWRHGDPTKHSE
jgi:hypothetical protein